MCVWTESRGSGEWDQAVWGAGVLPAGGGEPPRGEEGSPLLAANPGASRVSQQCRQQEGGAHAACSREETNRSSHTLIKMCYNFVCLFVMQLNGYHFQQHTTLVNFHCRIWMLKFECQLEERLSFLGKAIKCVWRNKGEALKPKRAELTAKHGRGGIMLSGLVIVSSEGNLNSNFNLKSTAGLLEDVTVLEHLEK